MADKPVTFGIIGADQNHVYANTAGLLDAGAVLKGWWTKGEPTPAMIPKPLLGANLTLTPEIRYGDKTYPAARRVRDRRELLDDPEIDMILVVAVPTDRAELSIEAMRAGKDVLSDKPGAVTLDEMARLRRAMTETGRIWAVNFSERTQLRSMEKATELVRQGMIGKVVQVISIGPHNHLGKSPLPWITDPALSGGTIVFIGSHQFDHFLHYTNSTEAEVVASTVANFYYPQHPKFEDFGEALVRSPNGVGYIQVSHYNPEGQRKNHPGDIRTLIIGTEGQIECRKYVDVGGRPGDDHLFLMTSDRSEFIDTSDVKISFFRNFLDDVRNRTWKTQPREHSLLASELAIQAEINATRLGNLK